MKKWFIILLLANLWLQASAQSTSDMDARLYRLCKTWGYMKYFSQHQCTVKWDTLLHGVIKSVLNTTSDDEFNTVLLDRLLNKVGNNVVVANPPGSLPDTNINFDDSWIQDPFFSSPVHDFLVTFSSHIYQSTRTCLDKYNDYSDPNYGGLIDFRKDMITIPLNYTQEADRLTALFQYWNIIEYFDPNRHLAVEPWDTALAHLIPEVRQAATDLEFQKVIARITSILRDGHAFIQSQVLEYQFWGGAGFAPVIMTHLNHQCVVSKVGNGISITPGDIVTQLNGYSLKTLQDSLADYIPGSDSAGFFFNLYVLMLEGPKDSLMSISLLDSNDHAYQVQISRSVDVSGYYNLLFSTGSTLPYHFTSCGYGYVDMNLLQSADVPEMYATFQSAPAIIFDIRNYPNGTLWDLAPLLFTQPVISAIYYKPALTNPPQHYYLPGWYYKFDDHANIGNWNNPDAYPGKIFILVNEKTISQAEYTCQYLSHHPNAKVIGSQTQGADGNISYNDLPNGIYTNFTSLGWYWDDGYQQQRNGVKIDTIVYPTREGLRHGRDEVLEAALDCLTGTESQPFTASTLSIYPNPGTGIFTIQPGQGLGSNSFITIYDETGKIRMSKLLDTSSDTGSLQIDFSGHAPGIYYLHFVSGRHLLKQKLVIL